MMPMKSTKLICRKKRNVNKTNKCISGNDGLFLSPHYSNTVSTYHNRSQHGSLDHPPDGSVVIHVPTSEGAGR